LTAVESGIIYYSWQHMQKLTFISKETLTCSVLFTAATLVLLLIDPGTNKTSQKQKLALLFLLVPAEMLTNAALSLNNISYLSQKEYSHPTAALAQDSQAVHQIDPGFYRTGQTYSRTKNDGLAHNLNTGSYFSSALEKTIPDFYGQIGNPDGDNYVTYSNGTLITDSLLGMKYFMSPKDSSEILQPKLQNQALTPLTIKPELTSDPLRKDLPLTRIYQNPWATTVGYSANSLLKNSKFGFNDPVGYQTTWLNDAT